MTWRIYDHYGYALIAVLGTLCALALLQWLIQNPKLADWRKSLHGVAQHADVLGQAEVDTRNIHLLLPTTRMILIGSRRQRRPRGCLFRHIR